MVQQIDLLVVKPQRSLVVRFIGGHSSCLYLLLLKTRENEGTVRDSEGVGWDMSIPQKLFVDCLFNGSLFPETSA